MHFRESNLWHGRRVVEHNVAGYIEASMLEWVGKKQTD